MIEIVPASASHVRPIANRIRDIDRRECEAFGHSVKEALRLSVRGSVLSWTALLNKRPEAMFGVVPVSVIEGRGRAWFLATDAAFGCARELLSGAPAVIEAMHRRFNRLENWVSTENAAAIRMLGRWGFELGEQAMMVRGVEFRPFWKDRRFV